MKPGVSDHVLSPDPNLTSTSETIPDTKLLFPLGSSSGKSPHRQISAINSVCAVVVLLIEMMVKAKPAT